MIIDIPKTYGALLIGALFGSFLSGVTTVQTITYFKLFRKDSRYIKALVLSVWALDMTHSALTWVGLWTWFIVQYSDTGSIMKIPLPISLTVIFTAVPTLLVHSHYVRRIFLLSGRKYWLALPIYFLAICRVCSACTCSAKMIHYGDFVTFRQNYQWLWSLGLALSSTVDVLITISLFLLLWTSRSQSLSLNGVLDSLIVYTLELGSLTALATIIAMICWLTSSSNLVFLGLYFVIAKLYANSMMASLNMRETLRQTHVRDASNQYVHGKMNSSDFHKRLPTTSGESAQPLSTVEVSVERSINYDASSAIAREFATRSSDFGY